MALLSSTAICTGLFSRKPPSRPISPAPESMYGLKYIGAAEVHRVLDMVNVVYRPLVDISQRANLHLPAENIGVERLIQPAVVVVAKQACFRLNSRSDGQSWANVPIFWFSHQSQWVAEAQRRFLLDRPFSSCLRASSCRRLPPETIYPISNRIQKVREAQAENQCPRKR